MYYIYVYSFLISAFLCGIIVFFSSFHLKYTSRDHGNASIQSMHDIPTPRIGGLAIFISILASAGFLMFSQNTSLGLMILFGATPLFISGLLEDIGFLINPKIRLFASFFAGFLGCYLTGYWLSNLDFEFLDRIIIYTPFAIIFTSFCVAGISNAFNIIDGMNGLSSGLAMIISLLLLIISNSAGDLAISSLILIIIFSILGFFIWNFPMGKLFLGDSGAYLVGFSLVWISIILVERNEAISPWCMFVIFSLPLIETVFSIFRRARQGKRKHDQPDDLHMHSLLLKRYLKKVFSSYSKLTQNNLTSLTVLCFSSLASLSGLLAVDSSIKSIFIFIVIFIVYLAVYSRLVNFKWKIIFFIK